MPACMYVCIKCIYLCEKRSILVCWHSNDAAKIYKGNFQSYDTAHVYIRFYAYAHSQIFDD